MTAPELREIKERLMSRDIVSVDEAVGIALRLLDQVERCLGLVDSLRNSIEALQGRK